MTNQKPTLLMLQTAITGLSLEQQSLVAEYRQVITDLFSRHPDEALMAFALIGAELELKR